MTVGRKKRSATFHPSNDTKQKLYWGWGEKEEVKVQLSLHLIIKYHTMKMYG
jgi:hypothetical protein